MSIITDTITTTKSIIKLHHEVATGLYVIQSDDDKMDMRLLDILWNLEKMAEDMLDLMEAGKETSVFKLEIIRQKFANTAAQFELCKLDEPGLIDPDYWGSDLETGEWHNDGAE